MSKIYCSNCGKLIPGNSNFCRFCGAPQHGREASVYHAEAPEVNNAAAAFVLAQSQKPASPKKAAEPEQKNETMVDHKLADVARLAFFFTYLGRTIALLALLVVSIVLDPIIPSILIVAYLIVIYIIATAIHDSFRYTIDERGFQKKYGIINKQHVTIPYRQIENVNITRSLTDMLFGLARINIETAGSSSETPRTIIGGRTTHAEGHLPGVTLKEARKVHDLLLDEMAGSNGG